MTSSCVSVDFVSEYAKINKSSGDFCGLLSVVAPKAEKNTCVDLSIVVDRSSSMQGQPIFLVKEACQFILNALGSEDRISIVDYGQDVNVAVPLTFCDNINKQRIAHQIGSIKTGGCTNLSGGLFAGMNQHLKPEDSPNMLSNMVPSFAGAAVQRLIKKDLPRPSESGISSARDPSKTVVRSVFLLTDGLANEGIRDANGICTEMRNMLESTDTELTVHCFGFGASHDPEMLTSIAHCGGGDFLYIEKASTVAATFGTALGGLSSTVATGVTLDFESFEKIQLRIPKALEKSFDIEYDAKKNLKCVKLRDMFAEERRDLLIEFRNVAQAVGRKEEEPEFEMVGEDGQITLNKLILGQVKMLKYTNMISNENIQKKEPVQFTVEIISGDLIAEANIDVVIHKIRISCVEALQAADEIATSNLSDARKLLEAQREDVTDFLKKVPAESQGFRILNNLVEDLSDALRDMDNQMRYQEIGSKKLKWHGAMHGKQRGMGQMNANCWTTPSQQAQQTTFYSSSAINSLPGGVQGVGHQMGMQGPVQIPQKRKKLMKAPQAQQFPMQQAQGIQAMPLPEARLSPFMFNAELKN